MVSFGLFLESSFDRSSQITKLINFSQDFYFDQKDFLGKKAKVQVLVQQPLPGGLVEHTKQPLVSPTDVTIMASPINPFKEELLQHDTKLVNFWWHYNKARIAEYQRLLQIKGRNATLPEIVIEILDRERQIAKIKEHARKQCSAEQFPVRWNASLHRVLRNADEETKVDQHERDVLRREIATHNNMQSTWNSNLK